MSIINDEKVIDIRHISKVYKLYDNPKDRLLDALKLTRKQKYKEYRALDDISFCVHKGETVGLIGTNGAGKSTLLKIITGVLTQTSGEVEVHGKISALLELGAGFNGEYTGIENIYQHGQVMGLTPEQIEKKKPEIIEFADIGDHLYQPVKTYSSGMFARLAFACAINVDPDILIVDEVLSVGDMAFQLKCFKKFEQFKEKGKTILFVTHNISDVLRNCTRTIIIDSGRKIFDGSVKDGVERYKKIIVGLDPEESKEEQITDEQLLAKNKNIQENMKKVEEIIKLKQELGRTDKANEEWKKHFTQNPNIVNYGNGKAEVVDYGIFDENGNYSLAIENDKEITLKSKILFKEDVKDPIFTMTLKDFKGLEICGTNTLIEKVVTGEFKKGDIAIAEFKQILNVAPGKYTLSFSCTHFDHRGELEVLNRKYDALLVEVLSMKNTVGLMNLDSKIKVTKI